MVKDTPKVIPPKKLAHVVLRTGRFQKMVEYYKNFLGAEASYENDHICFLTYDEEHHRIALIGMPNMPPSNRSISGLEHIAFTFESIHDLLLAYQQRKALGISPFWAINHGPTTSIYYQDPDGNQIETQVDNFNTIEEANEFMASEQFSMNPIGTDFDAEELIQRLASGEDEAGVKKRREIGPRDFSTVPQPAIPSY